MKRVRQNVGCIVGFHALWALLSIAKGNIFYADYQTHLERIGWTRANVTVKERESFLPSTESVDLCLGVEALMRIGAVGVYSFYPYALLPTAVAALPLVPVIFRVNALIYSYAP